MNSASRYNACCRACRQIQKFEFLPLCPISTSATAAPSPYPRRLRGTTLGRDLTTCALVARSSPSALFSSTGIAAIGTPLPDPVAAAATGVPEPTPDIAGAAMYAGIDPCHAAGTDIDPTNRALPSPAVATPRAPNPPPANGCRSVNALPAL